MIVEKINKAMSMIGTTSHGMSVTIACATLPPGSVSSLDVPIQYAFQPHPRSAHLHVQRTLATCPARSSRGVQCHGVQVSLLALS
jgi:hypothetical protein